MTERQENIICLCYAVAMVCCFSFVFGFCCLGLEVAFGQMGLVAIFSTLIMVVSPVLGVVFALIGKYYEKKGC